MPIKPRMTKQVAMQKLREQADKQLQQETWRPPKRVTKMVLDFSTTSEGLELGANLAEYIRYSGWTQKRFFLLGAALLIKENQDNPELILQIANYIQNIRVGRPKFQEDERSADSTEDASASSSSNPESNS